MDRNIDRNYIIILIGIIVLIEIMRTRVTETSSAYRDAPSVLLGPPAAGPYHQPMPGVLGGSQGGGRFLMGEEPL